MRKIFPGCCASAGEQSAKSRANRVRHGTFLLIVLLRVNGLHATYSALSDNNKGPIVNSGQNPKGKNYRIRTTSELSNTSANW